MKQMHPLQLEILKKLLFALELRYMELKPDTEIENSQFDFHLDQLIKLGYVEKTVNGYRLTAEGKEFANRMDTDEKKIQKQAKIGIVVACVRTTGSEREYLIYTRTKHPFYGCQGFMSGKIRWGDQVAESARRELYEEAHLYGDPVPIVLKHYRVYSADKQHVLEDKFMFFCRVENPTGDLEYSAEGKLEWVPASKVFDYVQRPFVSMKEFRNNIAEIDNYSGIMQFEEIDQLGELF